MPTLFEYLKRTFPTEVAKWDHTDYRLYAPKSLDDYAEIEVQLINDDRSRETIKIVIQ